MVFRMLWLKTVLPYITQQRPIGTPDLLDEEKYMGGRLVGSRKK